MSIKNWFNDESNEIRSFKGGSEFAFLSNMYKLENPITVSHIEYYSSENAYQASKFINLKTRFDISKMSPKESKAFAKSVFKDKQLQIEHPLDTSFMNYRTQLMFNIVFRKFEANPELNELLQSTGNKTIIEGNGWGDDFWGVSSKTGIGRNNLGIILMNVRERNSQLWGLYNDVE